ncbi:MAG: TolA-binding protein [Rubritalea sp.]|jgi:TolA-binding protein
MKFNKIMKRSNLVNTKQTLIFLALLLALPVTSQAQGKGKKAKAEEAANPRSRVSADIDRRAKHLYDKAMELMEYKQYERGLTMLNTVVRDNQGTTLAHMAHMSMGKHYLGLHKNKEALTHFLLLTRLLAPEPGEKQAEAQQELYNEALFQAGFSQYQGGQYSACFPLFRRLTEVAGKTKWANKAYYYIGMSHYNLKNWNKAIDSLSLVGTEVEDAGEELGRIEIGQRFYAKIDDADVPVMRKLGQPVTAKITVSSGDSEIITGVPVAGKKHEMLASAPTALGDAKPGDGVLQMIGGDSITVTYLDDSTMDGKKGVPRTGKVRAVSTGTVGFYLGDYSTPAYIAYPGQPQVLMLRDADLDKTPGAEKVTLTVTSRYKVEAQADAASEDAIDIFALEDVEQDVWKERDSITVTLIETSEGPEIRTGIFMGKIRLAPTEDGVEPNKSDAVLQTDELDELRVTYTDKVHLYGDEPRESDATIKVSGSVNSGVSADQYVVFDALLKARKSSVEAEALTGLGGIYKDMGLDQRAALRAKEALAKIDPIILNRAKLPGDLVEHSFKLKWESELLKSDFQAATATCLAFNRLYPESVLADQALMTLGRSLADKGDYEKSVESYKRVLELQNPISAAEAQFRIGEVLQKQAEESIKAADQHNSKWGKAGLSPATALQRVMGGAIAAYRNTYETYPESSYAAESLGRVVRHHVDTENFAMAADLLDSVFSDYPDAAFLDEMLLLWSSVGYRMGDSEIAKAKLRQLITDYPSSNHITEARQKLAGIEAESAKSSGE